jgi:hypothetical protein
MSIIDSLGTLFEGGLFARAVEPGAGEADREESFEGTCLNCGTARVGPHCHSCGQRAHIHRTMSEFGHDLLHGALHLEGKTFRTLPLLAWRPGQLTRRYIDGERARFVSPMALFLFSVFLMFAVFQIAGITPPTDFNGPVTGAQDSPAEAAKDLAELRKARATMGNNNPGAPFLDRQIENLETQLGRKPSSQPGAAPATAEEKNSVTGIRFIDHGIDKWRENPSLMAYKLQSNSYKFSWLLIPLSLPFVWLLFFWKRRLGQSFGMYDHAVFVTYSLSFMTLFYVLLVLLGGIGVGSGTLGLLGVFVPLLHIYKQLKGTYGLRRFSALWRTAVLAAFILVILFLFVDALLLLGAVG